MKAILFGGIFVLLIGSLFIPIRSLNLELPFNKNESRWYEQLERIESNLSKDIDVLFLGSSSMYNAIDDELFENGHSNSGAGLDDKGAKELGKRLLTEINNGDTIQYQASYQQYLDDLPDSDCMRCNNNNHGNNKKKECTNCNKTGKSTNFNKNYPFDIDNVREFAEFCLQCGGFEIC